MFGFSKKNFQVNLARHKKVESTDITIRPRKVVLLLLVIVVIFAMIFILTQSPSMSLVESTQDGVGVPPPVAVDPNGGKSTLELVVAEIQKQYLLPDGEVPTLAIITSLTELEGQEFFKKAAVDDVVLMYMEAKKGILWRPSTRQIIEVGPLSVLRAAEQLSTSSAHIRE